MSTAMKPFRRHRFGHCQCGFSLIESIVSMVLLTIGGLGIAASTANAIKINTDNQARAMALAAATKTLEPVYIRAQDPYPTTAGITDLHTLIKSYVAVQAVPGAGTQTAVAASAGVTVHGNVATGAMDDFVVSIDQAVDAVGTNVLTTAGPYVSPVTVAVLVRYQGIAGRRNADGGVALSDLKEVRTSFTYVLSG